MQRFKTCAGVTVFFAIENIPGVLQQNINVSTELVRLPKSQINLKRCYLPSWSAVKHANTFSVAATQKNSA